ncbi:unnamed protein product [Symbiodinium pilosum]|uniref:Uncharacterized protein n=1 Tax=Symbiodinium pilosum TaxID=2952 RepID=A0A812KCT6_SYMPI|nr:unnamed protein product [Symbiodinium pilosum]
MALSHLFCFYFMTRWCLCTGPGMSTGSDIGSTTRSMCLPKRRCFTGQGL